MPSWHILRDKQGNQLGLRMMPRPRHVKEFKLQVVREIKGGKTIAQTAKDHHIAESTVRDWFTQYEKRGEDAFDRVARVRTPSWHELLKSAAGLLIAFGFVLTIKLILGSHQALSTAPGIASMETSVLSLILAPQLIAEVLILFKAISSDHKGHLGLRVKDVLIALAAFAASLLIYETAIRYLNQSTAL